MNGSREELNDQPVALMAHRERAIEMFPDHDPGFGVAAAMWAREDLEQMLTELHGVVVGHGALVGETADGLEVLVGRQGPIRRARVGGSLGKARIIAREEARQDLIGLLERTRPRAPELADEAILEGPPQALDAPFGLRRGRRNPLDVQFSEGAAELREGMGTPLQLVVDRQWPLVCLGGDDPVSISVEGDGDAMMTDGVAQDHEVAVGVFLLAEDGGGHLARCVVDRGMQDEARAAALEPVVVTPVPLEHETGLGHALTPPAMPRGPAGTWTQKADG